MNETDQESRQRDKLAELFVDHPAHTQAVAESRDAPEMPRYVRREDPEIAGAGRVTGFALLAAGLCFLPWYAVRAMGASVTASGMETEHGPMCLMALAAVVVLTWTGQLVPSVRTAALLGATIAGAVAMLLLFLEWNQEAGMFRELIGLTAWFYLAAMATGAAAWFSWQRFQDCRMRT